MHFLNNYFYWGLGIGVFLGLIGILFAVNRLWETKGEVRRLKRHLADKLELEAEATNRLRQDLQELRQQNAVVDLEQEENGNSLPRRVFNALLNRPSSKNSDPVHDGGG